MKRRPTIRIYEGRDGRWCWSLATGNGRTVADSAEGYSTRGSAERAAIKLTAVVGSGPIIVTSNPGASAGA